MRDVNKLRDRTRIWEWNGKGHYTEKDIPQWVKDKIPQYLVKDSYGDIGIAFQYILKFERQGGNIFWLDDAIHFNKKGYEKIIALVERREVMLPNDIERWRREAFGEKS